VIERYGTGSRIDSAVERPVADCDLPDRSEIFLQPTDQSLDVVGDAAMILGVTPFA
jgi:hypothetical protein